MTCQEAIEILKHEHDYAQLLSYVNDALKIAISSIEKQIPKKPIENRYPWCICPNCRGSVYVKHIQEHIQSGEQTYCEHCGQALDWSDDE